MQSFPAPSTCARVNFWLVTAQAVRTRNGSEHFNVIYISNHFLRLAIARRAPPTSALLVDGPRPRARGLPAALAAVSRLRLGGRDPCCSAAASSSSDDDVADELKLLVSSVTPV